MEHKDKTRRVHDAEFKAKVLGECRQPGASIAAVALRHGLNANVVRQWLAKKGITAPHLVMENGSGLSRAERVSAREMASMLQAAWHSPYAAEYISSMPIAGTDGTMRKLTDPGKLHALGWHHKIDIEEGVQRMYRWYLGK